MYFNELYENSLTDEREQAKLAKQQKEQEFRNKQLANKLAERANQTGLLEHPIGKDGIVVAIFDEKATLSIYSKREKEAIKQQIKDMDVFGSNEIHSIIAITAPHHVILDGTSNSVSMELLTLADNNSYTTLSKLFENIVFSPPE